MTNNENVTPAPVATNAPKTRKRRTVEERKAALLAALAKLDRKDAMASDNPMVVRLQSIRGDLLKRIAIVKRDVEGYFNEAQNAWVTSPITDRIARKEQELIALRARAVESNGLYKVLPANLATVDALIEKAVAGEDVTIPDGILPAGSENAGTPEARVSVG